MCFEHFLQSAGVRPEDTEVRSLIDKHRFQAIEDFGPEFVSDAEVLVRLGFPWVRACELISKARRFLLRYGEREQLPLIKTAPSFEDFLHYSGVHDYCVSERALIKKHRFDDISDFVRDEHLHGPEVLVRLGFPFTTAWWLIKQAEICKGRFASPEV